MITQDFYKGKWVSVADRTPAGDIVLHTCRVISNYEERPGDGEVYLGEVENFLSYNVEPGEWEYHEYLDLRSWVFPFRSHQVFDTEEKARRSLLKQLMEV